MAAAVVWGEVSVSMTREHLTPNRCGNPKVFQSSASIAQKIPTSLKIKFEGPTAYTTNGKASKQQPSRTTLSQQQLSLLHGPTSAQIRPRAPTKYVDRANVICLFLERSRDRVRPIWSADQSSSSAGLQQHSSPSGVWNSQPNQISPNTASSRSQPS